MSPFRLNICNSLKTGWQRLQSWLYNRQIPMKKNIFKRPFIQNTMDVHHCISHASSLWLLGYFEVLWTQCYWISVCVCFYIFALLLAFRWAYAHALKSSFLCFYYCVYHLLLVGFTHATLLVEFIHARLVYWTRLPYAVERGPGLFLIHLCESVICFIYVTDTV